MFQSLQKNIGTINKKNKSTNSVAILRDTHLSSLGGFLQRAQRSLLLMAWQVLQITPLNTPGEFRLWALVSIILFFVIVLYLMLISVKMKYEF